METRKPNIFWAAVTPMDRYGYVAVSCTQQAELEMLDSCDLVIFEVNKRIPYTSGTVRVPIEQVDYFIDVDYPITHAPVAPATEEQLKIATMRPPSSRMATASSWASAACLTPWPMIWRIATTWASTPR